MDSSSGASLDESPPGPPLSSPLPPPRSPRPLFFKGPQEEDPETDPLPLVTAAGDVDGSGSDPAWTSELSDEWSDDDPTSSPGSSAPDKPAQLLSKKQMRDTAATAVTIGTGMAHTVAANTQAKKDVGLYL